MLKSVSAVLLGILLALGVGALVVFGIAWPVAERFFGTGLATTAFPAAIVVFAAAFSFYWGGMVAAYRAPSRRRLHGVAVGAVSFLISPVINLISGAADPLVNLRTPGTLLVTVALLVAVLAASYVGARRGEALYAHNEAHLRRRQRQQRRQKQ